MDIKDVRKKDQKELMQLLFEKRTALQELQFKLALDEEKRVRNARVLKKDIAQILTVMNEKRVAQEIQPEPTSTN